MRVHAPAVGKEQAASDHAGVVVAQASLPQDGPGPRLHRGGVERLLAGRGRLA